MKRFGIILGAAFALTGGAAPFLPTMAGASAATVEAPKAGDPIYIDLPPLVLPVIAGNNVEQVVQITITIEVSDEAKAVRIRSIKPRLTDAYVQNLYGALDRRAVMDGKAIDVDRLREALTRASIGVLGENSFNRILIQRIAQRSL